MIAPNAISVTICAVSSRSASRACSASSTECGSSASRRPRSTISSSNSSSSSVAGSSPASISSRRKNVEQIRQSLCGRDRVAEQPRPPLAEHRRDLVVQRIPLQQRVERDRRMRQGPFHVRHPAAGGACAAASSRDAGGRGGFVDRWDAGHPILGLADAPVSALMAPCGASPGSELAGYRIEAVEREDAGAAVLLARDPLEERAVALHVAGRAARGAARPALPGARPPARRGRAPAPARRLRRAHARGPRGRGRAGAAGPPAGRAAGRRPAEAGRRSGSSARSRPRSTRSRRRAPSRRR